MKTTEELTIKHDGCPNRHHCRKNDKQCCYLVKGKCYLEHTDVELFV